MQILYLPGLKNVVGDFLSRPAIPEPSGIIAMAAYPVDFEAEQNHCMETQHLLVGISHKITFRQAGPQCLVGYVSTGIFHPVYSRKIEKRHFF